MSSPLHPALVHLPLGIALLVPFVALAALVAIRRGALPRGSWGLVVALQAAVLVTGLAAMKSGENEEERVEAVVAEARIETHEERAEAFVWAAGLGTAVALAAMFVPGPTRILGHAGATLLALLVAALGVWTGKTGGELVYVHGAAAAYVSPGDRQALAAEATGIPQQELEDEREDD